MLRAGQLLGLARFFSKGNCYLAPIRHRVRFLSIWLDVVRPQVRDGMAILVVKVEFPAGLRLA